MWNKSQGVCKIIIHSDLNQKYHESKLSKMKTGEMMKFAID